MAINFDEWNKQFGGADAVKDLENAAKNNREFTEIPDGTYKCKLEKLELAESKSGKPMIKGQFRIQAGEMRKSCIFMNQVFTRGYPQYRALQFLKSMNVYDPNDIDFNGDFAEFNDLLLDLAEDASDMVFFVKKTKNGEFQNLEIVDVQ